jgi:FkbM family methyltransferase
LKPGHDRTGLEECEAEGKGSTRKSLTLTDWAINYLCFRRQREVTVLASASRLANAWRMTRLYENWPLALLDRFHLVPSWTVVYRLRGGVKLAGLAGSYDMDLINEIWMDHFYSPVVELRIGKGWVVADLGSYKGFFSVLAATSAQGVKVYAFEPFPQNFELLRKNVELNGLSNVKCFNVAIGGRDEKGILHLYAKHNFQTFYSRTDAAPCGELPVEVWSMRRALGVIDERVDLLKLNIEGMEFEALFSCSSSDLERVDRIVLEYHEEDINCGHKVSDLVGFLEMHKFAVQLFPVRHVLAAWRNREVTVESE